MFNMYVYIYIYIYINVYIYILFILIYIYIYIYILYIYDVLHCRPILKFFPLPISKDPLDIKYVLSSSPHFLE